MLYEILEDLCVIGAFKPRRNTGITFIYPSKETISKLDKIKKEVFMPLSCPKCSNVMKNRLDKPNYKIHKMCFDCVINIESELKQIIIKDSMSNKYIFGLNGCDTIVSKNKIWESLVKCFGRKDASKLMPESYILDDPDEMDYFAKTFNPQENAIYILKKNVQRKEGLKLTRDYNEIIKGAKDNYRVVQKYITDLYLINQRKINLRIYLLIVIKDNTVNFYLCRKGKCIYTNKKYNDNDLDFESNITSYHLDMDVYNKNPRNFDELREYIDNESGKNKGDYLFNKIELLMKKISLCLSKNLYQSKNIKGTVSFQLFGTDVIFDSKLNPFLLEMNKGPDMTPRDRTDEEMKNLVQTDMFRTVGILGGGGSGEENSFYKIY